MSIHYPPETIERLAARAETPVLSNRAERAFNLPPLLFALTVGAYVAFLAILGLAFRNENLLVPFAIFFIYLAMAFGVPAMWAIVQKRPAGRFQTWSEFLDEGIHIHTGPISARGAIAQVLVLPGLIVGWAFAMAVIAALI